MSDTRYNLPAPLSPEEKVERYQSFMDHRKQLHDALIQVSGRYTQWIMTLAGGALALSITYVEKLQPAVASGKWILVASWIMLCVSLLAALLSLQFSADATKKAIRNHDENFGNLMSGSHCPPLANGFTQWTKWCAWISTICFSIGVLLIAAFVSVCPPGNLKPETKPNQDNVRQIIATPADTKAKP